MLLENSSYLPRDSVWSTCVFNLYLCYVHVYSVSTLLALYVCESVKRTRVVV